MRTNHSNFPEPQYLRIHNSRHPTVGQEHEELGSTWPTHDPHLMIKETESSAWMFTVHYCLSNAWSVGLGEYYSDICPVKDKNALYAALPNPWGRKADLLKRRREFGLLLSGLQLLDNQKNVITLSYLHSLHFLPTWGNLLLSTVWEAKSWFSSHTSLTATFWIKTS